MPVPDADLLCRFIRPGDWSRGTGRPRPGAFKDRSGLSLWHLGLLEQHSASPEDLLIESLTGCGQAHHTAGDYRQYAAEAAQLAGRPLQIAVEWRTEHSFVAEPWLPWRYAHIQVEVSLGDDEVQIRFRRLLAINARFVIPPTFGN